MHAPKHKAPFRVPSGVVVCVACKARQSLERQTDPKEQTIPPGPPWKFPAGWLVGPAGWYCCLDHVRARDGFPAIGHTDTKKEGEKR